MKQEEFNQLLKNSDLPKEFSIRIDELIRVINNQEERINSLEGTITSLLNKNLL